MTATKLNLDHLVTIVRTRTAIVCSERDCKEPKNIEAIILESLNEKAVKKTLSDLEFPDTARLANPIVEKVFSALYAHTKLYFDIEDFMFQYFEDYMTIPSTSKKSKGKVEVNYIEVHMELMKSLVMSKKIEFRGLTVHAKVIALTYLLLAWSCKKRQNMFNPIKIFLSDFLASLLVYVVLPCTNYQSCNRDVTQCVTDLPEFNKIFTHVWASPKNSLFQQIVLVRMLKILDIPDDQVVIPTDKSPTSLAGTVKDYFEKHYSSDRRHPISEDVLQVVKDQSRYMAIRKRSLRRRTVADRTRYKMDAVMEKMDIDRFNGVDIMESINFVKECISDVTSHCDLCEPRRLLLMPSRRIEHNSETLVAMLHHKILAGEVVGIDPHIKFDKTSTSCWFEDSLFKVIRHYTVQILKESPEKRARSAVSLERVIALRYYLNLTLTKLTFNKDQKTHQDVLFWFVALRALVMFSLKKQPDGVSQVATKLPEYASTLSMVIHPDLASDF